MAKLGQYDITKMTAQEVAEAGAIHLLEQSKQSIDDEQECLYDCDGVCCVAAPFIANYRDGMEGLRWKDLVKVCSNQPSNHEDLITELQSVHDLGGLINWRGDLKNLFKRFDLDPSILNDWEWDEQLNKYKKTA